MIPLTKKLYLLGTYHSLENDYRGYIYYEDGRLVIERREYEVGFRIAAKRGFIRSCAKKGENFYRDNRLTDLGKAWCKLTG